VKCDLNKHTVSINSMKYRAPFLSPHLDISQTKTPSIIHRQCWFSYFSTFVFSLCPRDSNDSSDSSDSSNRSDSSDNNDNSHSSDSSDRSYSSDSSDRSDRSDGSDSSDSTASTVTTPSVQRLGNWNSVQRKAKFFLFCTVSRRTLGSEQPAFQYKSRGIVFLWGYKWPGLEADRG